MHERTNLCKIVAGSTRVFKILQGSAICILYNTAQIYNLTEPTAILQTPFLNLCGFENLTLIFFGHFQCKEKTLKNQHSVHILMQGLVCGLINKGIVPVC